MSTQNGTLCTCGCCDDEALASLPELSNNPGLPALKYRVGTHGSFKEFMLSRFFRHEALGKLGTRSDDDHSVATIDAWATVLDVLSFYQERVINEGFLRTATERLSVLELARHIDYKLRPGVAASTHLAFTMNDAPGSPPSAILPAGTKVQSVPKQDELPQIFETSDELEARVVWNGLNVQTRKKHIPVFGERVIYLAGINTGLQLGDALLFIGDERSQSAGSERWDFRKVQQVIPDNAANHTKVTWAKGLGSAEFNIHPAGINFKVYALRQKAFVFGYNAPDFRLLSDTIKTRFIKSGLIAQYYSGKALATPIMTRTENTVNYTKNATLPTGIPSTNFSVRWSGVFLSKAQGAYTFITDADDGVRLWVNNQLLIDNWTDHPVAHDTGTIALQANTLYSIRLEYYQGGVDYVMVLSWSGPGLAQQVMPSDVFFNNENSDDWPDYNVAGISAAADKISLDALYPKIVEDSWIVAATSEYEEVYKVAGTEESARKAFSLSGKSTVLKLSGENLVEKFDTHVRDLVLYGQSEELAIAETPVDTWLNYGREVTLEQLMPDLPAEKTVILSGKRKRLRLLNPLNKKARDIEFKAYGTGALIRKLLPGDSLIVTAIPIPAAGLQTIYLRDDAGVEGYTQLLADEYAFAPSGKEDAEVSEVHEIESLLPNTNPTTVVLKELVANLYDPAATQLLANVAHATHGETKVETLGSGNGSKVFQQFQLKQKPLTFVSAPTANGIETTLEVRVNDILWSETSSFYEAGPRDKVYTTAIADDGTVTIQFGDGKTGARLPSGVENVRATYRVGIGLAGMVDAGQLSLLMTPQLGVNKVTNPLPASGADDPEPRDAARNNAPLTVLTLDRVISVRDYEDFTRGFAGIGKARADVLWRGERQVVYITIASSNKSPIDKQSDLYKNLVAAISTSGHTNNEVFIEDYKLITFSVKARIQIEPAYLFEQVKTAVIAALQTRFSFEMRVFGEGLTPAEVIATIQSVAGVVYTDLEAINGTDPAVQTSFRIPGNIARLSGNSILPAELLLIDDQQITITQILA